MIQNEKHVGQVSQGIAGVLTALTVLATVIFTLLGLFGVVDMEAIRVQTGALAYVVAVGSFLAESARCRRHRGRQPA